MANEKKPSKGAVSAAPTPDALDLIKIERRIERLEKERLKLEGKSSLRPGRSQKLSEIDNELGKLRWACVSAQEHVRASRYQSEIYEREAATAKRDAAQQQELDERRLRELAAQGGRSYRDALRAFAASWKAKRKTAVSSETSDDDDNDPQ